ncbi:MAG: hypothetical protein QOC68_1158 [Solirubrobacteraceae bacterium]|jgi:hypothetical protein|nr:hypothetical protein [Solirubrobacteraceae bacterium]
MRPRPLLLALLLAAAIAGCGQAPSSAGKFKGSEKAVADTIEKLQTAAQNRKPADICSDVLSRALVDKLKTAGHDCVDEMDKITSDADNFELAVTDVTITGTTATARVKARKGGRDNAVTTFALAREDGQWRLTSFGSA